MKLRLLITLIVLLGGCAMDGGIVGTGNRIDCEALAKKGEPVPDECKRDPSTVR